MGTSAIVKFTVTILIVAVLILGWAALQGLGTALGGGVQEWLVR